MNSLQKLESFDDLFLIKQFFKQTFVISKHYREAACSELWAKLY